MSEKLKQVAFTRQEIFEGLRGVYAEWQEMAAVRDRCDKVRLPDYEAMLDYIEQHGIPPRPVTCDNCGGYMPGHATGNFDICECDPPPWNKKP